MGRLRNELPVVTMMMAMRQQVLLTVLPLQTKLMMLPLPPKLLVVLSHQARRRR